MSPNDLPAGLRTRQSLDAGEIKFFDILKNHIDKVINAPKERTLVDDYVPEPPKKKKKWPILAIIAGVLALAITLGVVVPNLANYSQGLSYQEIDDGNAYEVIGLGSCTDTDIIIPSVYKGKPVTSIGFNAFYSQSSLTSVTIPDGVTSIGSSAFYGCSGLTIVTIPDSVTSIGYTAFYGCSSLPSVTIPYSVTNIDWCAFAGCSRLVSINFGGTKAQWKEISKGSSWNANTGSYKIYCTDGTIYK